MMKSFVKRNAFIVGSFLVLVFAVVALIISNGVNHQAEASVQQKADAADVQLGQVQDKVASDEAAVNDALLGVSKDRLEADDKVIGDLLKRATTWDSHKTYTEARQAIKNIYKVDEDSQFMTTFLPPDPVNTDSQGRQYPYIDAVGLNSQLASYVPKVVSVTGTEYNYMVQVDVTSRSVNDKAKSGATSVVMLTVDGEGKVSNLVAFASADQTKSSN